MRKGLLYLAGLFLALGCLTGCRKKEVRPGDVAGYDQGEAYLSIWVHSMQFRYPENPGPAAGAAKSICLSMIFV